MTARRLAWLGATTAMAVVALTVTAAAPSAPSRIVDRTVACTLGPVTGNVRDLDLYATPPLADQGASYAGLLYVGTGNTAPTSALVFANSKGGPTRYWRPSLTPGVFIAGQRCVAVHREVPLTSKGLPGPPVQFEKEVSCPVVGRALVHVRALLQSPAAWLSYRDGYSGAQRNITKASITVRAEHSGKPLAFMQMDSSGRTRIWYSPGCTL
jgi:hypothetical protein